ncbi:MAG: hypothetical protein HN675_14725 [Opitutae bacterium]|nr:hypothetical protein [Opitutae bacterium]
MPDKCRSIMTRIRQVGVVGDNAGCIWMDDSLDLILDKLEALGDLRVCLVVIV